MPLKFSNIPIVKQVIAPVNPEPAEPVKTEPAKPVRKVDINSLAVKLKLDAEMLSATKFRYKKGIVTVSHIPHAYHWMEMEIAHRDAKEDAALEAAAKMLYTKTGGTGVWEGMPWEHRVIWRWKALARHFGQEW